MALDPTARIYSPYHMKCYCTTQNANAKGKCAESDVWHKNLQLAMILAVKITSVAIIWREIQRKYS